MVVIVVVILLPDFIQLQITSNGNKTANIYVKNCSVYIGYSVTISTEHFFYINICSFIAVGSNLEVNKIWQ